MNEYVWLIGERSVTSEQLAAEIMASAYPEDDDPPEDVNCEQI
jgi:hypothetical protein